MASQARLRFLRVVLLGLALPILAWGEPLLIGLSFATAESNLYRSQALSGAAHLKLGESAPMEVFFQNEKRDFGSVLLDETTLGFAFNYQKGGAQYGEVRLMHTPGAVFLPAYRASIEHHVVQGLWDTMVVLRGAQYNQPSHLIPGFSLGQRRDFELLFVEARIHAAQDEGWHSAVELLAGAKLTPELSIRTGATTGEEIVDPGIFNRMVSLATTFEWRRTKGLMLNAGYVTLWGERRFETGFLMGGGWSW